MNRAPLRAGLGAAALCTLAACGPPTPAALPPPIPPSAAQRFLAAFAEAQARVDPALRVTARECANAGQVYTCALAPEAPASAAPSSAPSPMRLTLTLNANTITATKVEAPPAEAATQFATISAIAATQGEPLNTNGMISAFKRDLGFAGKPRAGRSYTAKRTYGVVSCVLEERGVNACTVTPLVATRDLPAPIRD